MQSELERVGLLGRDRELHLICSAYEEARSGRASMVLVSGPDGIGKSRLIDELSPTAISGRVLRTRCSLGDDVERGLLEPSVRCPEVAIDAPPGCHCDAVLIDDLHLGTPDLHARIGRWLLRSTSRMRFLLATVSDAALQMRSPLATRIEQWRQDGATLVRLPPLPAEATELLVRAEISGSLALDVVQQIVSVSDGNPRYAIQLASEAARNGRADLLVPEAAKKTLETARRLLSPDCFEAVRICAVLGGRFRLEWIARILSRPLSDVAEALQAACDILLIHEVEASGWFSFVERAVEKAAYVSLITPKRFSLHAKVVASLESQRAEPEVAMVMALQLDALRDPDAAELLVRAARSSVESGDLSQAIELYTRATRYIGRDAPDWAKVHLEYLQSLRAAGRYQDMIEVIESVSPLADENTQIELLEQLFCAHLNNNDRHRAHGVVTSMRSLSVESSTRADTLSLVLCAAHCWAGEIDEATEMLNLVKPNADRDARFRWRFAFSSLAIDATRVPFADLMYRVDALVKLASCVSVAAINHSYLIGASIGLRNGDLSAGGLCLMEAKRVISDLPNQESSVLQREILKCELQKMLLAGELPAARRAILSQLSWRDSGKYNESLLSGIAVTVGVRMGDDALVNAFFNPVVLREAIASREHELCGFLFSGYADVMAQRSLLPSLVESLRECLRLEIFDPFFYVMRAAVQYLPKEDLQEIETIVAAGKCGSTLPILATHVSFARSIIRLRRGDSYGSVRDARRAVEGYHSAGWRLCEASARELAGQRRAALRLYDACGAFADVKRLQKGGIRKPRSPYYGSGITPREYEVGGLVARGLSDPQVASALRISPRTVNHHVGALLAKLGVASRTSITAIALDQHGVGDV